MSIVLVGQFIGQLPCSCAIVPTASFGQLIDREKDILAPQTRRIYELKTEKPLLTLRLTYGSMIRIANSRIIEPALGGSATATFPCSSIAG